MNEVMSERGAAISWMNEVMSGVDASTIEDE
jgi:hypothetical protein